MATLSETNGDFEDDATRGLLRTEDGQTSEYLKDKANEYFKCEHNRSYFIKLHFGFVCDERFVMYYIRRCSSGSL